MRGSLRLAPAFIGGYLLCFNLAAQGTLSDYERAQQFLSWNIRKLVFEAEIEPHWIGNGDRFWYENEKPGGKEYVLIDPERNTRGAASERDRSTEEKPKPEGLSPDGHWQAEIKDYNLYLKDTSTGQEVQLTTDGIRDWAYATPLPDGRMMIEQRTSDVKQAPAVFWSHDSKKLVTYRMDSRNGARFVITQYAPPFQLRPASYSLVYPLPGEALSTAEPIVFEIESRKRTEVKMEPLQMFFQEGPGFRWSDDNRHFTFDFTERGYKRIELREADAQTGAVRTLIEEKSETFVDPDASIQRWLNHDTEIVASSERDGWNHLYLYSAESATLRNRITQGNWVVRGVEHIDEKRRQVYFTAAGRERGEDPYLRHLYRINLDGNGLDLLTPEPADHEIEFSPNGKYFIDTYSRPDLPPKSLLREANGHVVRVLEAADIGLLIKKGFHLPEPFKGKGRDGETDIYGIIWRPSNFSPAHKYPVIEQIYSGPQGFFVPKTFSAYRNPAQAVAELGFIVVQIDGMGTAGRSKAFHDHCYKNLGDSGLPDHIAVLKQMAQKYSYMDLSRVGIYGVSAGGYDATHAMLTHPDFYKVAVSTSGVQDNRLDKTWWNELWMSYPVGPWYAEQSNITLAKNLQGDLLLIHGDIDNNVPLADTMRMADALIKANKNFDMYIVPNMYHGDSGIMWVARRRWDYFVQHLLGVTPPRNFELKPPPKGESSSRRRRRAD